MNVFEIYLNDILSPQLTAFDVPASAVCKVTENIKTQMYSLLQIWKDTTIRNTILLIGLEEGSFYDSDASDTVKSFVVVTIRNSMFETLASVGYKNLGLSRMVTDDEVKEVTSKALDYFSEINFDELSLEPDYTNTDNLYLRLKEKYPAAWKALETLANTEKCNIHFPKVKSLPEAEFSKLLNTTTSEDPQKVIKVKLDGYDENLDAGLLEYLSDVITYDNGTFVVTCFKMISRNIEKLFRVLDFVLCCNKPCVMVNYLITNGHVERRNPLLRASHGQSEPLEKLSDFTGLQTKHARLLKSLNF